MLGVRIDKSIKPIKMRCSEVHESSIREGPHDGRADSKVYNSCL